jgi:ribosomal protein L16 Arg81 hydroxylase
MVANCRSALGFAGRIDCRAYLSADKAGYTPHFDDKAVLTLQIEGTKKWLVAPHPAVQYPLDNAGRQPDGVYRYFRENPNVDAWERFDQPQFEKTATAYTLRPGDLLMVPAGVWHAACAEGHSLSVAVTFNHVGTGSAHEIILSAIRNVLIQDSRWRQPPPMVPITSDDQNASSLDNLDRFFAARLDDLRTEIERMQRNRAEIVKIWSSRISN